jgi:sugar O-acyltransferase (sialic acid O-acetyltransferase NeuD family)
MGLKTAVESPVAMTSFVLVGHNHLFGDVAEMIDACGGRVTRIVQNQPEVPHAGRKSLAQRIAQHEEVVRAAGRPAAIEVVLFEQFVPQAGEVYLLGFTGHHQRPLRDEVRRRFGLTFGTLVHPRAIVSPSARIGEGSWICAGAILASGVHIGEHVLINRGATIGHDTEIGDFGIVQPGANLAGHVRCGRGAIVGIGASVIEDVEIGEFARVAAGAAVIGDVPASTLVAGVPAVVKKQLTRDR